ncbi:MAG: superoxide dismutase family protein [Phycisphaeraceae bacterium]|nr:superoxide dismutase family protein [Phycisphaeraceae bacterium]
MRGLLTILALLTLFVSVIVLATAKPATHETPQVRYVQTLPVEHEDDAHDSAAHDSAAPQVAEAICILQPTQGNQARGVVRFHQTTDGVAVEVTIKNLAAGGIHAMHIHEFGDLSSPDGTSAGSHYNPEGHPHGLPDSGPMRHAGDFGNVTADQDGMVRLNSTFSNISISGERNPILGRAVVLHAQPDDGSQPVGNAGSRIAIGVIGVAPEQVRPPTDAPAHDMSGDEMEGEEDQGPPPAPRD